MNKFDIIGDLNVNMQPVPTSYVGGMSFYESLCNLLEVINGLITSNNLGADEIANLQTKKQNIVDYLEDISVKRKLDENGNFTGTWNGVEMHLSSEGLASDWNGAKGSFPTVTKRLNDNDTKVVDNTTQLAKIATEYYLTGITNLQALIDSMPTDGGTIIIPKGTFYINTDITLNKPITFKGFGESSILVFNKVIATDLVPANYLRLYDFKAICNNSDSCFKISKEVETNINPSNTLNVDLLIDNVIFYTDLQDTYNCFLKIGQITQSSITNSSFMNRKQYSKSSGIQFIGAGQTGIRNVNVDNCKFQGLFYGIYCEGDGVNYVYTCGLMLSNLTIMNSKYGLYLKNLDWCHIHNSMLDYLETPIYAYNVSNFKIKNNYIFTTLGDLETACIDLVYENPSDYVSWFEIVGNHMWNKKYGQLSSGISTYGVRLKIKSTSKNNLINNNIINANQIHRVSKGISIQCENTASFLSYLGNTSINNNRLRQCDVGIENNNNVLLTNCEAIGNSFDLVTTQYSGTTGLRTSYMNTNIASGTVTVPANNRFGSTIAFNTIDFTKVIALNIYYDTNVYTYAPMIYKRNSGGKVEVDIVTATANTIDTVYSFDIVYLT